MNDQEIAEADDNRNGGDGEDRHGEIEDNLPASLVPGKRAHPSASPESAAAQKRFPIRTATITLIPASPPRPPSRLNQAVFGAAVLGQCKV